FPLFLVIFSWPHLFHLPPGVFEGTVNLIPLDRAGYYLKLFLLVSFVLILIQLEGTFTASSGIKRWQIKFMILGTGGILAFGIYDAGQALLYSALNLNLFPVRSMVMIVADAVILFALIRHRLLDVDIFVSRYVLYNSVTLLASGIYLFIVGLAVYGIRHFGGEAYIPFIPLLVFALLTGMAVVLLSEEVRRKLKDFINTHFYKNKHDYRLKWQEFNLAVSTKLSMAELSSSAASWLADTMGTSNAAIWIYDPGRQSFELAGQIGYPPVVSSWPAGSQFVQLLREKASPILNVSIPPSFTPLPPNPPTPTSSVSPTSYPLHPDILSVYLLSVPLFSGQEMSGFAMLGAKITRDPYDFHDLEFLKIAGDQIAGQINRVQITEALSKAKEMEALQAVSTFFIHDLKNLASMLSLVVQNIPANYDNPEFRKDAFR
ncbi:MAG TPA: hypothetical protein VN944_06460, partial [Nitrospiria bacterium]|nr:hypothetical protein [Nitrospiria bacterium]